MYYSNYIAAVLLAFAPAVHSPYVRSERQGQMGRRNIVVAFGSLSFLAFDVSPSNKVSVLLYDPCISTGRGSHDRIELHHCDDLHGSLAIKPPYLVLAQEYLLRVVVSW